MVGFRFAHIYSSALSSFCKNVCLRERISLFSTATHPAPPAVAMMQGLRRAVSSDHDLNLKAEHTSAAQPENQGDFQASLDKGECQTLLNKKLANKHLYLLPRIWRHFAATWNVTKPISVL